MTDEIELLAAIGGDASLRYASRDELQGLLAQAQASDELLQAVATGNGSPLRRQFAVQHEPQAPQTLPERLPGHEDDEPEELPVPPQQPPAPDRHAR